MLIGTVDISGDSALDGGHLMLGAKTSAPVVCACNTSNTPPLCISSMALSMRMGSSDPRANASQDKSRCQLGCPEPPLEENMGMGADSCWQAGSEWQLLGQWGKSRQVGNTCNSRPGSSFEQPVAQLPSPRGSCSASSTPLHSPISRKGTTSPRDALATPHARGKPGSLEPFAPVPISMASTQSTHQSHCQSIKARSEQSAGR